VGSLTPGSLVLVGAIVLVYGVLVGGTWVRRTPGKLWDTVSTILLFVVAAVATLNLVYVGARQSDAFEKAKDRLDCVSEQLAAVRIQAAMPSCTVAWDED
jgi:membrane protein YdbS with pleckstrin-like domain